MKRPAPCPGISILTAVVCLFLCITASRAEITREILKELPLADAPQAMALSRDGSTAYILGAKSIMLFSLQEGAVTDTVPTNGTFSSIALLGDDETVLLAGRSPQQLTVMRIARTYDLPRGDSPVIGPAGAPVTITAFLDYQCPYCARVYPVLQQVLARYPQQANLVIKHYPLPMHRHAQLASLAALAAARQDKYDALSELLFKNYKSIDDATLKQYAKEAGLDMDRFEKDLADPALKRIVDQDRQLGARVNVKGVPMIFINGEAANARSLDAFAGMIDKALAKKKR